MLDFSGRTVLVTGGGAGIGRATALAFGRAGASVSVAELLPERATAVADEMTAAGIPNCVEALDIRDTTAMEGFLQRIAAKFGGLDILINNVGDYMGVSKRFEEHSDDDLETLYGTNLRSLMQVTRSAIPMIRARGGGSIISISSIEAFRGIALTPVYSALKHAITGLTRSLALDLAQDGIRVNAIAPETTDTAQVPIDYMVAPEHKHRIPGWIPLGRFGRPEDCAGAALYLASDLAGWVTGTTINVDGGALAAAGWYRDPNGIWTVMPVITGNGMNL